MRLFATRVWGFDPTTWPVVVFGEQGYRTSLLERSEPGDCIIFVATKGEMPAEDEKGRVLGMAEIGRRGVFSRTLISDADLNPHDFDAQGNFKWPVGIPMVRAWLFPAKPLLTDLMKQLPRSATPGAVELSEQQVELILRLERVEVPLPAHAVILKEQEQLEGVPNRLPTTGPRPTDWSSTVTHSTRQPASTYVFRWGGSDLWKIGWAVDPKERLATVNTHIPIELLSASWKLFLTQGWSDTVSAQAMEQRVLDLLTPYRTMGERVRCSESDLHLAWGTALITATV
jgi:hypothetical protein